MSKKLKVSVLGDGGWGTSLAILNSRKGSETLLWSAFQDYAKELEAKRVNSKFLPGISIPNDIKITSDLAEAVNFGDVLVLAAPSQYLRNMLFKMREFDLSQKILVSVAKGIEVKTLCRPSEIIFSVLGPVKLVVLSGPSHAEEVARNIPTLVVVGSKDAHLSKTIQELFRDPYFRVYTQDDIIGIELGGALKNVIAIGAGICDGLGYGANTKAALLSRGLLEIVHLGVRMGANPNTFVGLSGLGDLVTTCISQYGRNLRVGREIGEGKKLKEVLAGMQMVAEGVETSRSAYQLAKKYNVDCAIITQINKVLFEDKDPKEAILELMNREPREEMRQY